MKQHSMIAAARVAGAPLGMGHVTVHPADGASPFAVFGDLADHVRARGERIVAQFVFGGTGNVRDGLRELERATGGVNWPVTWIHADGDAGKETTGTQAYVVADPAARPVRLGDRIVGTCYRDACADYCLLGDVLPADPTASREAQTRSVYERCEAALETVGMDYSHVMRTWLYLDRLLDWYAEFNAVRTRFYEERGVFERLLPASTGIGIANRHGAALVLCALAVKVRDRRMTLREVASPLQCPATNYRSSFSRAVELETPAYRQLHISGTASIAADGRSIHEGDLRAQIATTMDVVAAILQSRGMDWTHATRGIAYVKNLADAAATQDCLARLLPVPGVVMLGHADVCRPELLFEIELDAAVVGPIPGPAATIRTRSKETP